MAEAAIDMIDSSIQYVVLTYKEVCNTVVTVHNNVEIIANLLQCRSVLIVGLYD